MSDDRQWQAPGATPAVPSTPAIPTPPPVPGYQSAPPPVPGYAAPSPAPVGPPIYASTPPGWTPPPKPGLIPLRPLDLGTILGSSFRVLRRNPRPTFGTALLIQMIVSVVTLGLVGGFTYAALSRVDFSGSDNQDAISAGAVGLVIVAAVISLLLSVVASALLEGIIVLEVSRGTLGQKLRYKQLWQLLRGRLRALVGFTFLIGAAVVVVGGIIAGLIALFVATLGTVGIVIGVLLGIFGGLGLVVLYAWLAIKLSFVACAIVIERLPIRAAIRRSWTLSRGYFWRTLGIRLLVAAIIYVVTQIVSAPLSVISPVLTTLIDPNGQNAPTVSIAVVVITVLTFVVAIVFGAIGSVIQTSTTALLYIDLRMRKEGLDLELARFVEERQAGRGVEDPYVTAAPADSSPA